MEGIFLFYSMEVRGVNVQSGLYVDNKTSSFFVYC